MRHIGNLPNEAQARVFGDFLIARGIKNEIEPDSDGSSLVWIHDDDHLAEAQVWLKKFRADPDALEFRNASSDAAKARKIEAQKLAEYRARIRSRRSIWPKFGGYGVGVLTYALIAVCVVVAIYTNLGNNFDLVRHFFISDPLQTDSGFLPEVFQHGEVWRLLTPIFVHLSVPHIIFNMLWLYNLGCMIEARQSWRVLLSLVVVSALCSNIAQYWMHGPAFGGMSGVVYALVGYVWIRGRYDRTSGVFLDRQNLILSLAWLVLCFTGLLGPIANTAHVVGLITGMIWGRVAAWLKSRRPE